MEEEENLARWLDVKYRERLVQVGLAQGFCGACMHAARRPRYLLHDVLCTAEVLDVGDMGICTV